MLGMVDHRLVLLFLLLRPMNGLMLCVRIAFIVRLIYVVGLALYLNRHVVVRHMWLTGLQKIFIG